MKFFMRIKTYIYIKKLIKLLETGTKKKIYGINVLIMSIIMTVFSKLLLVVAAF